MERLDLWMTTMGRQQKRTPRLPALLLAALSAHVSADGSTVSPVLSDDYTAFYESEVARASLPSLDPAELDRVYSLDRGVGSYLLDPSVAASGVEEDLAHMRRLLSALHTQQHPPKESCRERRLLVTQFSPKSFEGIGSILKLLVHGLGEAAHANRTLIWGLDLPYVFENSRDSWFSDAPIYEAGPDVGLAPRFVTLASGLTVECSGWRGRGGGPYACFFLPLSSCSLEDVDAAELRRMAVDGHSDSGRVRIQEARRGPAAFHPPYTNPLFAPLFGSSPRMTWPRHKWAAALAAYTFRFKPAVGAWMEGHRADVWNASGAPGLRHQHAAPDASSAAAAASSTSRPAVWGLHVRHGDVTALSDIYGNRKVFKWSEFFAAARAKAAALLQAQGASPAPSGLPAALFVASDDTQTGKVVKNENRPKARAAWPGGADGAPRVFTVRDEHRYRTPHGSHTVAADGGCVRDVCALHAHDILAYRAAPEQKNVPRHERIMRVLSESIAELYLLSHVDFLVTQGSSHFSTMAVLFIHARTGGAFPAATQEYLDEALIAEGVVQCSLLHGSLNGTASVPRGQGAARWLSHTRRFFEGHTQAVNPKAPPGTAPGPVFPVDDSAYRLALAHGLPTFPGATFYTEARRWTGGETGLPIWPGECPLAPAGGQKLKAHVVELINHGADHSDLHPAQAMRCWEAATKLLARLRAGSKQPSPGVPKNSKREEERRHLGELAEVVRANALALQLQQCFPYSMDAASVRRFLGVVIGPHHPVLQEAGHRVGLPASTTTRSADAHGEEL